MDTSTVCPSTMINPSAHRQAGLPRGTTYFTYQGAGSASGNLSLFNEPIHVPRSRAYLTLRTMDTYTVGKRRKFVKKGPQAAIYGFQGQRGHPYLPQKRGSLKLFLLQYPMEFAMRAMPLNGILLPKIQCHF